MTPRTARITDTPLQALGASPPAETPESTGALEPSRQPARAGAAMAGGQLAGLPDSSGVDLLMAVAELAVNQDR